MMRKGKNRATVRIRRGRGGMKTVEEKGKVTGKETRFLLKNYAILFIILS